MSIPEGNVTSIFTTPWENVRTALIHALKQLGYKVLSTEDSPITGSGSKPIMGDTPVGHGLVLGDLKFLVYFQTNSGLLSRSRILTASIFSNKSDLSLISIDAADDDDVKYVWQAHLAYPAYEKIGKKILNEINGFLKSHPQIHTVPPKPQSSPEPIKKPTVKQLSPEPTIKPTVKLSPEAELERIYNKWRGRGIASEEIQHRCSAITEPIMNQFFRFADLYSAKKLLDDEKIDEMLKYGGELVVNLEIIAFTSGFDYCVSGRQFFEAQSSDGKAKLSEEVLTLLAEAAKPTIQFFNLLHEKCVLNNVFTEEKSHRMMYHLSEAIKAAAGELFSVGVFYVSSGQWAQHQQRA